MNILGLNITRFLILLLLLAGNTYPQLFFFGRNKVQYESFNWKIIKTEHFDIYYYDEFGEMAEIGAAYAEEAYSELKVKFNHSVINRIPLIFYNTHLHFQQTNTLPGFIPEGVGGFFEFIKGRVVIPFLGSLEEFRHVIRHELVHVFMTSKLMNQVRDHRLIEEKYPPLWFIEGLAEFWSTSWDSKAEMVMRDAVINGLFVPVHNIDRISGSFLMYKEGQSFLIFISEEYGTTKVSEIIENFWKFKKFEDVLEFTLGEKIAEIDKKWEYSLRKRYFPLLNTKKPHAIDSQKLTIDGYNFSPRIISNAKDSSLFYIANVDGYSSIYKIENYYEKIFEDESVPKLFIRGEKTAVFESFHIFQPSLAISQKYIAFVSKNEGSDVLYICSIEDGNILTEIKHKKMISIKSPSFSNDDKKLVFSAIDNKGFSDIFLFSFADSSIQRITDDYYDDKDPVFDQNNSDIVFSSDRTEGTHAGKYNLFRYNYSEGTYEYITYVGYDVTMPKFSPDFKALFCLAEVNDIQNIWRLETDSLSNNKMCMSKVTDFITTVLDYDPINNEEIVYSGFEEFSFHLYYYKKSGRDSDREKIEFDYYGAAGKWIPESINLSSEACGLEYENEYTIDYAVSQVITDPVYGTRGGALFTLSDLLGDDRYMFLLYNTAEVQSEILKNFNIAITRVNSEKRSNFGYGIFHYNGRRYDIRESDEFFYERSYGGFFSLIYPLSVFRRLEASVSIANTDKEIPENLFISQKSLLLSNSISLVFDNSLWMPTGPLDGTRYRVLMGYTTDLRYSNINYYSIIADFRHYLRTSFRSTLALRTSIYINDGKQPRRYFAGGSWDLRGWPRWSVRGEKLWLSSAEFRFPIIDQIYIKFPFFGLGVAGIRGALFFDAGGAWDSEYDETLGSLGGGIRLNLFNIIALRYDVGKKIENDFKNFQPRLFYQFFFGWDF